MEEEGSNLLNLADSVLLKKESSFRELSQTEGPFKKYFCSTVDEVTTSFCLDSRIFGQSPIFEPKTRQKPVVSVKPFERNVSLEVMNLHCILAQQPAECRNFLICSFCLIFIPLWITFLRFIS